MRIIKRKITINGAPYDIWLGLKTEIIARRPHFQLFYYLDDPNNRENKSNKPVPIKNKMGFENEKAAIEFGKSFMIDLYTKMLNK